MDELFECINDGIIKRYTFRVASLWTARASLQLLSALVRLHASRGIRAKFSVPKCRAMFINSAALNLNCTRAAPPACVCESFHYQFLVPPWAKPRSKLAAVNTSATRDRRVTSRCQPSRNSNSVARPRNFPRPLQLRPSIIRIPDSTVGTADLCFPCEFLCLR